MTTTHTLETPGVDLVYDVHGPLPTADGRPGRSPAISVAWSS